MRIAQVLAPWLPVPPHGYGGIEIVVYHLVEELVKRGHEVTLYASGDSKTSAKLVPVFEKALGNDGNLKNNPYTLLQQVYPAFIHAGEYDVIHSHSLIHSLFLEHFIKTPVVHTIHGTITPGDASTEKNNLYMKFKDSKFISISNQQRTGIPDLNYVGTVYNGIDMAKFPKGFGKGGYVSWLGRITPKKGVVEAIEVAKKAGIPMKLAAFVDAVDQAFFDAHVKPRLDSSVEFMGELSDADRSRLLGEARACLFPIKWNEPFGLVMVEAMATGTPVLAFKRGSVPEIVADGVSGNIIESDATLSPESPDEAGIDRMTDALEKILLMDESTYANLRIETRKHVENTFTISAMVNGYEEIYKKVSGLSG